MKSVSVLACKVMLAVIMCALAVMPIGCATDQLGETAAEGHRRHQRNLRLNRQEMASDLDSLLLLDKPSKLTDKRIP